MSAMEQMLVRVLSQVIPPETMELLQKEKLQEFLEQANAYVVAQNEKLETLAKLQNETLAKLDIVMEHINNVEQSSSGSGGSDSGSDRNSGGSNGNGS